MISSVSFKGKSGQAYRFEAWPMDTKFKSVGGVYIVTCRTFEDRTFRTKASHRSLALGQTANLAGPLLTKTELTKLTGQGANCVCVCAVGDANRRASIEKDLIEANEQCGGLLYLFYSPVPEKAPGVASGASEAS
jgi:hypothetical protein